MIGKLTNTRSARGFTLLELLIVMSIIIILATVGLPQYQRMMQHARETVLRDDLHQLRKALDQYGADKGKLPQSLSELADGGYMREVPVDPMTKSKDTWTTTQAEPDPNNPASQVGIYSVKSGSDRTALDGTRYADW